MHYPGKEGVPASGYIPHDAGKCRELIQPPALLNPQALGAGTHISAPYIGPGKGAKHLAFKGVTLEGEEGFLP